MRDAFAKEITRLAQEDPRIVLLSGDIGNRLFDPFKAAVPDRFFNCGVAEANLMGMAAGMAMNGMRPIAYTITPFITARCYEQIRVDVCYHAVPVVIVGVGAGLSYASLGATHHSLEDLAILRVLPGMTILCPADAHEVRALLPQVFNLPGPVYFRLGKKGEPLVHAQQPELKIGEAIALRRGSEVCIVATGTIMPEVLATAEALESTGISCQVYSLPTVKPLPAAWLRRQFEHFPLVVSIEEHSRIGGLGSAIAECLPNWGRLKAGFLSIGAPDEFLHEAGETDHVRKLFGLDAASMAGAVRAKLEELS